MDDYNRKSEDLIEEIEGLISYVEKGGRDRTGGGRRDDSVQKFESELRELFEHTAVGMYRTTPDGRILMANPALVRMLGFSTFEEMAQRNLEENGFEPDYRRKQFKQRLESEGKIVGLESVWTTRHGDRLVIIENARAVRDQNGNILYYEGTAEDITQRKRAEEALAESEEKYRTLVEDTEQGITLFKDGHVVFANRAVEAMLGYSLEELSSFSSEEVTALIHPQDREWVVRHMTSRLAGEASPEELEYRIVRKDGEIRWLSVTATVTGYEGGFTIQTYNTDITERKRADEALRESEKRFRALAEKSPNMIFINVGGRVVYANEKCERVMGYRKEEFYANGFDFLALIAPEDRGLVREKFAQHTAGQEIGTYEYSLMTKSGERIEAIIATKLIEYRRERAILGIVTDITGRKRAEEALQKAHDELEERVRERTAQLTSSNKQLEQEVAERRLAEERIVIFRKFAEASEQGLGMADLEGNITYGNATLCRLLGFKGPEDACGTNIADRYSEDDLPILQNEILPAVIEGGHQTVEMPLVSVEGEIIPAIQSIFRICDDQGKPLYLANVVTDITERKKAEDELRKHRDHLEEMAVERTSELQKSNEELRESERRFRSLSEAAFEGIALGEKGVMIDGNEAVAEIYGCSLDELRGREVIELVAPEDRDLVMKNMLSGYEGVYEHRGIRQDGSIIDLEVRGRSVTRDGRRMRLTALRDITDRKKAENELRKSEEHYRMLAETMNEGLAQINAEGRCVYVNKKHCEIFGCSSDEMIGRNWTEFYDGDAGKVIESQLTGRRKGLAKQYEVTTTREDGRQVHLLISPQPIFDEDGEFKGSLSILTDITELKKAEEKAREHQSELAHVWRVNTMGEMASGLAHELNQPLCAILNYANACLRMMERQVDVCGELVDPIEQIATQAERAGEIIKRIRGLVAKRRPQKSAADINGIVREVVGMEKSEANLKSITMKAELAEDLPEVFVHNVEIEEVILNLVRNAFDAMSDVSVERREVTIVTCMAKSDEVEVCVRDTGKGFAALGVEKIFDSFFTTKADGLGIGLSISRTIVESHGGRLWAEANPDCGASFRFTLPVEVTDAAMDKPVGYCEDKEESISNGENV